MMWPAESDGDMGGQVSESIKWHFFEDEQILSSQIHQYYLFKLIIVLDT